MAMAFVLFLDSSWTDLLSHPGLMDFLTCCARGIDPLMILECRYGVPPLSLGVVVSSRASVAGALVARLSSLA